MDHVGVCEHEAGFLAGRVAGRGGRVPVVGGHLDLPPGQGAYPPELVLGQCLGGVEIDRACARVPQEAVDDGQVEAKALPGGGAGCDHDVLAALRRLPALSLVSPELPDPLSGKRIGELEVQVTGERSRLPGAAGQYGFRHQLGVALGREDIEQFGSHASVPKQEHVQECHRAFR